MPFVFGAEVPSKNVSSRLKNVTLCTNLCGKGVTFLREEWLWMSTKYHQKWVQIPPWCEPLLRIPTLRWVLRHHPCYFSNISAISREYLQSMVTLNLSSTCRMSACRFCAQLATFCVVSGDMSRHFSVMSQTQENVVSARVSKRHDIWRHVGNFPTCR